MNYYIDLFSPNTALAFEKSDQGITGFRISRKTYAENQHIGPGDKFICYVTRLQRFVGILEVTSTSFIDDTPIFVEKNDPFVLRYKVKPIVWLPLDKAIPIYSDGVWDKLSSTKNLDRDRDKQGIAYKAKLASSPFIWPKEDGIFLERLLVEQSKDLKDYPLSEEDLRKLKSNKIKLNDKREIAVSIPDDEEEDIGGEDKEEISNKRESIIIQAKLAEIGEKLGMKIWIPRGDRTRVLELWSPDESSLLEDLPFNFDEVTIKTIQNIDVLWVKGRAIIRAFEVEDTTSIYSGILRMADLLSLLPTLKITIHIVSPSARRDLVFKQISRPVFAVMESGPLSELCSYISYESVRDLAKENRLENMKDTIVDEFAEYVDE